MDPNQQMEKYLNLLSTRQKLVAANIANADTPGFRTKDIDFQFEFLSQSMLPPTAPAAASKPNVVEVGGLKVKNDGNDVNVDREMRLLSETALRFQFVSQLMKRDLNQMRLAIKDGAR